MKTKELRSMPIDELNKKLDELKRELMKDNAQVALGAALKSPGKLRMVKKNIARILTITQEKNRGGIENAKHSNSPKYKSVGGTGWTKSTSARPNTKRVGGIMEIAVVGSDTFTLGFRLAGIKNVRVFTKELDITDINNDNLSAGFQGSSISRASGFANNSSQGNNINNQSWGDVKMDSSQSSINRDSFPQIRDSEMSDGIVCGLCGGPAKRIGNCAIRCTSCNTTQRSGCGE